MFLSQQPDSQPMEIRTPQEGLTALNDDAERNRLLAEMAEYSTDMISRHTPDSWRFIYASPAVTHLLGYSVEEIVGMSAYELYHPDDVDNFALRTSKVSYERGLYTHTYRFRCKDGQYTWLESTSRSIRDPETGQLAEILVVSRDASRRVEAEQANRRLARVLESTSDLVIFADQHHAITHLNESARRALELTGNTDELTLTDLFPHDSYRRLQEIAFPAAIRDGNWVGELEMQGQRPGVIPVMLELLAHRSLHDDIEYFSIVAHNLSEAKAAEAQLDQYKAEMEHAGRLATVGEMATSLAHEINQPLTAIVNYLRGIQHRLDRQGALSAEDLRQPLDKTVSTARRAGEIVRRVMDFTRKHEPKRETLDISAVIDDMLQFCRPNAERHGVLIKDISRRPLPEISGDRIQLEQVLLNLLVNAIEASDTTNPPPMVWVEAQVVDQRHLRVCVADEGSGIPAGSADQIFGQFYTTKTAGLGMGLAISRSLVENSGGELWLEKNSANGARFCFTLPLAVRELDGS